MCCFRCADREILAIMKEVSLFLWHLQLGVNQRDCRLHSSASQGGRAAHSALHERAIHEQEELVGEHLWLSRICLHGEITKTCTHGLFELERYLVCWMCELGELNGRL